MQYNGFAGFRTDEGFVTKLSFAFEVSEAIRIESIRAWISGSGSALFAIEPMDFSDSIHGFSSSVPLEQVHNAPAKWQGVNSLRWDLQPGNVYTFYIQAPDIPYGYGYHGPIPIVPNNYFYFIGGSFHDYSEIPTDAPFGLEFSGSQLSAIPEPATYGLTGVGLLALLTATRAWKRKMRNGVGVVSVAER